MIIAAFPGPWRRRVSLLAGALFVAGSALVATAQKPVPSAQSELAPPPQTDASGEDEEIVSLAAYNVKADRIEDFGLRIESAPYPDAARLLTAATFWFAKFAPLITAVVPNTAASKAGLQPGERILESDGRSTVGRLFSTGKFGQWTKSQKRKWADVSAGKTNVTWTLLIESPATNTIRTVKLTVPTPPPHWGASTWSRPTERKPATVMEAGPLAERSREVLDNGIATTLPWPFTSVGAGAVPRSGPSDVGYEWRIEHEQRLHRIVVVQAGGHTRVFLETVSPATGRRIYLTSPSGALEKAWRWGREENIALIKAKTPAAAAQVGLIPFDEAHLGFRHELDLWTNKVRKLSPRWPMEVIPGFDPDAIFAVLVPKRDRTPPAKTARPPSAEFLKLPTATDAQRGLFADAYGKLGADQDRWAYTETSHTIDDQRIVVTRVDPSKPDAERCVLVSIDGKAPTSAQIERWRNDGGDVPKPLGDLPPLASLVDLKDLRVAREETGAIVFELPIRAGNAEFPADKFEASFRVSRSTRAFEEIGVRLRDSFHVAGLVKVTDAGLLARFRSLDPALAPQPVILQGGGTARLVLVNISRDFKATRTDFKRVAPYETKPDP